MPAGLLLSDTAQGTRSTSYLADRYGRDSVVTDVQGTTRLAYHATRGVVDSIVTPYGDTLTYSDPFGLKLCFVGDRADAARETLEGATGTRISVDSRGCATGYAITVAGLNRRYRSAQGMLSDVIRSDALVEASYGGRGFTRRTVPPQLQVENRDWLNHTGYATCSGPSFVWRSIMPISLLYQTTQAWQASAIHELQHAQDYVLGRVPSEQGGVDAEDAYNRAAGLPLRCVYQ